MASKLIKILLFIISVWGILMPTVPHQFCSINCIWALRCMLFFFIIIYQSMTQKAFLEYYIEIFLENFLFLRPCTFMSLSYNIYRANIWYICNREFKIINNTYREYGFYLFCSVYVHLKVYRLALHQYISTLCIYHIVHFDTERNNTLYHKFFYTNHYYIW